MVGFCAASSAEEAQPPLLHADTSRGAVATPLEVFRPLFAASRGRPVQETLVQETLMSGAELLIESHCATRARRLTVSWGREREG
jgi:hypothetical protein